MNAFKKKGYFWITLALFIFSLTLHWIFAWYASVQDALEHHQTPQVSDYFIKTMRDTMENWQSEFLQLIWQVAGLTYLLYVGSPTSKEGDERKEAKMDLILKKLYPEEAERIFADLESRYPKK